MDWGVGPESIGRWTARRLDQLPRSAWPTLSGLDWRDRPRSELDCSHPPVHRQSIGGPSAALPGRSCSPTARWTAAAVSPSPRDLTATGATIWSRPWTAVHFLPSWFGPGSVSPSRRPPARQSTVTRLRGPAGGPRPLVHQRLQQRGCAGERIAVHQPCPPRLLFQGL
jgi:hypothetical protein